jgi:hypothetical protein
MQNGQVEKREIHAERGASRECVKKEREQKIVFGIYICAAALCMHRVRESERAQVCFYIFVNTPSRECVR